MRLLATGKTFMLKRFDLTIRHLVMRLTIALTILFSLNVSAKAFTQKVTIPDRQLSWSQLFESINKQTGYDFLYNEKELAKIPVARAGFRNASLEEVLNQYFDGKSIRYQIINKVIVVTLNTEKELHAPENFFPSPPPPIPIKGIVTNEKGEPVEGVSVTIKGSSTSVISNSKGEFEIAVQGARATLVFTHVGYESREVRLSGQTFLEVQLQPRVDELNDLVIIGYGSQRRKDLTGAISSVKIKEEEASQFVSVDALIRGRAPGVNVTTNNAAPGASLSMKIRGVNSLRGENEPLYVVDGIIMDSPAENEVNAISVGNYNAQEAQSGLSGINPRDIESIEILKDAAATAIYGSRGANGVVLITTKQGRGAPKLNFNSTISVDLVSKHIPMLNGLEYARYQNEARALDGVSPLYDIDANNSIRLHVPADVLQQFPDSVGRLQEPVDWQDRIFRPTITQNHRLSLAGSSDRTRYYLALGVLNQQGIVEGSALKQGDIRLNLDRDISNKVKISAKLSSVLSQNNMIIGTELSGINNLIRNITASPPLRTSADYLLEQGLVGEEFEDLLGPETFIAGYDDNTQEFRLLTGLQLTYRISKVFTYQLNFGGDLRIKNRERWQGPETGAGRLYNGMAGQSSLNRLRYNVDNLLLFNYQIDKNHKIDGTIGVVLDESLFRSQAIQGSDYSLNSLRFNGISFANVFYPIRLVKSKNTLLSGLSRINYTFNDKYLISAAIRADGSSKFAEGNKFSYFPSFSVAWKAINEPFLRNNTLFSDLKLRASWGRTGNQGIGPYGTFTPYNFATYPNADDNLAVGAAVGSIANKDLRWETTEQVNAGINFGLLRNRINATVDVFSKKTSDLLQNIPIPSSTGFETMLVNLGDITNRGLEIGIDALLIDKKVKWSVGGNISFVRNKIDYLGLTPSQFGKDELVAFLGNRISNAQITDPANIFIQGRQIGLFWGYQTAGVYVDQTAADAGPRYLGVANQPGDVVYIDQNGDGNINDLDRTIIGNPNPKFNFGLNTSVSLNQLTLDLFFYGVYGNEIINSNLWDQINPFINSPRNISRTAYQNAWRTDAPSDKYLRLNAAPNSNLTDRYVENGSFMRLGQATLSWKVPVKGNKTFKGLNIYASGRNLFTITNYSGYDPEVNSFAFDGTRIGIDLASYPNVRSFLLGFNVTF